MSKSTVAGPAELVKHLLMIPLVYLDNFLGIPNATLQLILLRNNVMPLLGSKFSNCFLFHKKKRKKKKKYTSVLARKALNHLTSLHLSLSNCSLSSCKSHGWASALFIEHTSLLPTPGPLFLLILLPGISLIQRLMVFFFFQISA